MTRTLTIGVYGFFPHSFMDTLEAVNVAMVTDIRRRRALRGATYAWANAARLEGLLRTAGIGYLHEPQLAPTSEIRAIQRAADQAHGIGKRARRALDGAFVSAYEQRVLRQLDPLETWERLSPSGEDIALLGRAVCTRKEE